MLTFTETPIIQMKNLPKTYRSILIEVPRLFSAWDVAAYPVWSHNQKLNRQWFQWKRLRRHVHDLESGAPRVEPWSPKGPGQKASGSRRRTAFDFTIRRRTAFDFTITVSSLDLNCLCVSFLCCVNYIETTFMWYMLLWKFDTAQVS